MTTPQVAEAERVRHRRLRNLQFAAEARWRGKLAIPQKCHPLIRRMFEIMNSEQVMISEVAPRAGVCRHTFNIWRKRQSPRLFDFEAALNALGYELRIVRRRDAMAPAESHGETR